MKGRVEALEQQIVELRKEVAELRRLLNTGGQRLGPMPETAKEQEARVKAITEKIVQAMTPSCPECNSPQNVTRESPLKGDRPDEWYCTACDFAWQVEG